jgi:hypothetical protein
LFFFFLLIKNNFPQKIELIEKTTTIDTIKVNVKNNQHAPVFITLFHLPFLSNINLLNFFLLNTQNFILVELN